MNIQQLLSLFCFQIAKETLSCHNVYDSTKVSIMENLATWIGILGAWMKKNEDFNGSLQQYFDFVLCYWPVIWFSWWCPWWTNCRDLSFKFHGVEMIVKRTRIPLWKGRTGLETGVDGVISLNASRPLVWSEVGKMPWMSLKPIVEVRPTHLVCLLHIGRLQQSSHIAPPNMTRPGSRKLVKHLSTSVIETKGKIIAKLWDLVFIVN